jgi:hypothetical protein
MIDENFIVYHCLKGNDFLFECQFKNLSKENKQIVKTVYSVLCDKVKRYIIIVNSDIRAVKIRVYSTGKDSKRFIDIICTFEFITKTDFVMVNHTIHESIKLAIEKTIQEVM